MSIMTIIGFSILGIGFSIFTGSGIRNAVLMSKTRGTEEIHDLNIMGVDSFELSAFIGSLGILMIIIGLF